MSKTKKIDNDTFSKILQICKEAYPNAIVKEIKPKTWKPKKQ